jgi:hypothetical protein
MNRMNALAVPVYLVAAILILFPLMDTLLSVWPLQVGEVAWRFGAVGLFSRAMMTPLLGLLMAFTVAMLLEQRTMVRVLAVAGGLSALIIAGTSVFFLLDAVQMRAQVNPQAKTAFDVASVVALAKYGITISILVVFAIVGWKQSRGSRKAASSRKAATPLVSDTVRA